MTERSAPIVFEPAAIDQAMLMASAARSADPIGPTGMLQGGLTLLHGAVKPMVRREVKAILEQDRAAGYGLTGT